jgi:hypothetical protein
MSWKKLINGTHIYINANGKEIGNVNLVGKKARWRWQSSLKKPLQRSGWWGIAPSLKDAQETVENYIKEHYGNT